MSTSFSNPRLLSFRDQGAPYRGHWVIYATSHVGTYAACHELSEDSRELRVLEQRQLDSAAAAKRFSAHLILHGWTPELINAEQGYRLLGA